MSKKIKAIKFIIFWCIIYNIVLSISQTVASSINIRLSEIDLPNNIECTIQTTDAVVKGQTAASSYKPAVLNNGIKINVPPFIESGEKIILDTRTLEYVKKVN